MGFFILLIKCKFKKIFLAQGLNSPTANTPRNFDITLGHSPNIPNLSIAGLMSASIINESENIENMKRSLERQNRNVIELVYIYIFIICYFDFFLKNHLLIIDKLKYDIHVYIF